MKALATTTLEITYNYVIPNKDELLLKMEEIENTFSSIFGDTDDIEVDDYEVVDNTTVFTVLIYSEGTYVREEIERGLWVDYVDGAFDYECLSDMIEEAFPDATIECVSYEIN